MVSVLCQERQLDLKPSVVHVDFEVAMHNAVRSVFSNARIDCCHFHLGLTEGPTCLYLYICSIINKTYLPVILPVKVARKRKGFCAQT